MPVPPEWGEDPKPPPVSVGRRRKKKTEPPHPDVPTGSGLDTPAPLPQRTQALNSSFGGVAPERVAMPPEFTADLPDPPVVGLNTGAGAARQSPPPVVVGRRRPAPQDFVTQPSPELLPVAGDTTPQQFGIPYTGRTLNSPTPTRSTPAQFGPNVPGAVATFDRAARSPNPAAPLPAQAVNPHAGESPTDRMVREAGERLSAANAEQPKKRKGIGGRILSGLESFVIEGGRPFRNQMPHNAQELAYGLGRGAGGAAYGAVNTEYPSRVRIESKRQLAGQQYDEALKRQTEETQNRLRDAQADYATGRGPREDRKVEMQAAYNKWRAGNGDARLSETENYHRFLLAERQAGRLSEQEYRRSVLEDRDLDRGQRDRFEQGRNDRWTKKFDADERDRQIKNTLAERRTRAYEEAVRKGGSGGGGASDVKKAQAAAEAEVYDDAVSEIEGDLYELGRTPESERGSDYARGKASLERQLRDNRLKAEKARAASGQPTKASLTREQLKAMGTEEEVRRFATENSKHPDVLVRMWKEARGTK